MPDIYLASAYRAVDLGNVGGVNLGWEVCKQSETVIMSLRNLLQYAEHNVGRRGWWGETREEGTENLWR